MRFALVVLVACSSPAQPRSEPVPQVVTAVPGAPIQLVAVTIDGTAAVSSGGSSLRLWPVFDGTREPVVVHGPDPKRLALIHRDGFSIAITDHADLVTVIELGEAGELRDRYTLDQPVLEVIPTATRFLALTADRRLMAIDRHPQLVTPASRIVALVAALPDPMVIVDDRGTYRGRWLTSALSFGEATPVLELPRDARAFAMSSDHSLLVAMAGNVLQEILVASGKQIPLANEIADGAGFIGDNKLVTWSRRTIHVDNQPLADVESTSAVVATGTRAAVSASFEGLGVYDGVALTRLAYGHEVIDHLRATPDGLAVTFVDETQFLVDTKLQLRQQIDPPDDSRPAVAWTLRSPDGSRYVRADPHQIWMYDARDGRLLWHVELELRQLVWSQDGSQLWATNGSLARIDPATGRIVAARCGFSFGRRTVEATAYATHTAYCE